MIKENKGNIILVGVLFIITLLVGIYGLIMSIETDKNPKPSNIPSAPSITLEDSYSFNEIDIERICDFTINNLCEEEIGSYTKNNVKYDLSIKYEKLENNEFNLNINSNDKTFIIIQKMKGILNILKVYNKTYLVVDVINNNENTLKIYDQDGTNIETQTIETKGRIVYNEDNITFKSLNCDSEFKNNLFDAILTIENNKTNILYEKTEELNTSGSKCE